MFVPPLPEEPRPDVRRTRRKLICQDASGASSDCSSSLSSPPQSFHRWSQRSSRSLLSHSFTFFSATLPLLNPPSSPAFSSPQEKKHPSSCYCYLKGATGLELCVCVCVLRAPPSVPPHTHTHTHSPPLLTTKHPHALLFLLLPPAREERQGVDGAAVSRP